MNREAAEKFVRDQMDGESISVSCAIHGGEFFFGCYASYEDLLNFAELILLTAEYRKIGQLLSSVPDSDEGAVAKEMLEPLLETAKLSYKKVVASILHREGEEGSLDVRTFINQLDSIKDEQTKH